MPCAKSSEAHSLDAGHSVGIHVLAVSEKVAAVGALDLEAELLVECDAARVSKDKNVRGALSGSRYLDRSRQYSVTLRRRAWVNKGAIPKELLGGKEHTWV